MVISYHDEWSDEILEDENQESDVEGEEVEETGVQLRESLLD